MSFKPLNGNILIKIDSQEESKGGILTLRKEAQNKGVVKYTGDDRIPVGTRVHINLSQHKGNTIVNDEKLLVITIEAINAILED